MTVKKFSSIPNDSKKNAWGRFLFGVDEIEMKAELTVKMIDFGQMKNE